MIKNAFHYVTRKSLKSIIILLVITAMSTLCLIVYQLKMPQTEHQKKLLEI